MMKINYYCSITLSALLMGGCTSSEMGKEVGPQLGSKKDAYTTVTIKLPSLSGSATKAEPGYDAGLAGEYKVTDLTLLFFRTPVDGADPSTVAEGDFVLSEVVSTIPDLSTGTVLPAGSIPDDSPPSAGGFIKKFTTQPISIDSRSVRVLALLNVGEIKAIAQPLLKIGYAFKGINKAIPLTHTIDILTGNAKDRFLMTSSPVYAAPAMTTLAVCAPQSSAEAATANPVTIHVERIVAKVQLKANPVAYQEEAANTTYYFTVAEGSHKGDKISILDWALGNTNTSSYPFRVVGAGWAELGDVWSGAICPSSATPGSRIHWAEDPNYSLGAYTPSPFASPAGIDKAEVNNEWPAKTEYCIENTCNFAYMNKSVVTRLIVKAKYVPNASNQVGGNNTFDTDGTWWSFTTVAAHYSAQNMYKKIIDWVTGSLTATHPKMPASPDAADITVPEMNPLNVTSLKWVVKLTADGASHYKLTEVSYLPTGGGTPITLDEAALAGFQSSMGKIQKYTKGICYYEIFIRHFTEDEGGYAPADGTAWVKDGDYTAAQLGRYGVVRNNWYTVTINSITQPGDPVIPTDPDEPVDSQTSYIDCSIEISAWAKRDHNIDL